MKNFDKIENFEKCIISKKKRKFFEKKFTK